jgi:hypothetical protein
VKTLWSLAAITEVLIAEFARQDRGRLNLIRADENLRPALHRERTRPAGTLDLQLASRKGKVREPLAVGPR